MRLFSLYLFMAWFGPVFLTPSFALTLSQVKSEKDQALPLPDDHGTGAFSPLRIPRPPKWLQFQMTNSSNSVSPKRMRYKLEGKDSTWQYISANWVIWLRIVEINRDKVIAGETYSMKGESEGWNNDPLTTPMAPFQGKLLAPAAASAIRVYFISTQGGSEASAGQILIDHISVTHRSGAGQAEAHYSLAPVKGEQLQQPLGTPDNWGREGEKPALAQLLWRPDNTKNPALFINDNDANHFGVWRAIDIPASIEQGDTIEMECQLAYSFSSCRATHTVGYPDLAPGTYCFRISESNTSGIPTGNEVSLPFEILPPLTQRIEFWFALLASLIAILIFIVRGIIRQRLKRQLAQAEAQNILEKERTRIAQDIHDDLGATMAEIALLSELAQLTADETTKDPLHHIFDRARQATRSLDEIVWAIKPQNDTLESLTRYISQFTGSYLQLAGIRFRLDAPENMPNCTLTSAQRHNLFLAVKEAVHNIVKHAQATEVCLSIMIQGAALLIELQDNGNGAVPLPDAPVTRGSANMQKRMEHIGGTYWRTGAAGKGTTVHLTFPLKLD
jgi:signal transduction histidine kinase